MRPEWKRAFLSNRVEENMRRLTGRSRFAGSRGQNLVEYSLIILLVVLAVIGGLVIVGPMLGSIFSNIPPAL
jgi:Flp pilus assembly pilin Flp